MDEPEGTVTENRKAVESAKNKYPMLANLDFSVYSDPNYRASDYDDYGDIEVFHKGEQKIDYTPEYSYPNPNINQDNVLYNPDRIPERYTQDAINLDAISHLGHNDPTYDALNAIIGNEYPDAATSEMLPLYEKMTGKNLMKMSDSKRPTKNKWIPQVLEAWDDAPRRYQNAIDGLVRDYIISKEHPNPNDPIYKALNYVKYNPQWDSKNNAPFYLNQLYDYIITGKRPANILPEVIVTGHKHAEGGFEDGGSLDNTLPEVVVTAKRTPKKANGGRVLMGQQGTNPAWSALYQSLSRKRGRLPETEVRDTVNYAIQRGKELNIPYEFTRSILSNAVQESGLIHNARRGSHYGLIQATWIPRNYNAKQQIDMIYDMAQNPAKYKDNRVLGYEANLLNKSYRNPSTRNFFNWTERAGVRAWNAAPRDVYDSAFDSYYKSVYANPEPTVDYVSQHIVELPDALRVAKPVILPSQKLGGLLRFISFKKVEN